MKTDLQIAQENTMDNIEKIARKAKIDPDYLEVYGKNKAKIDLKIMDKNTILVRIGVKDDAVHKGGFNIFGKKFGDYGQDIIMSIAYSERA